MMKSVQVEGILEGALVPLCARVAPAVCALGVRSAASQTATAVPAQIS